MAIRFLIGRAGSGKSAACTEDIRKRLEADPQGAPLILLVPEQATFQAEHALIQAPGLKGLLRAQVLSFRRLAWRVMQEAGGTAGVPIDETGKHMLLQRIMGGSADRLKLLRAGGERLGLIGKLGELFTEWKRYCLSPDELRRAAEHGAAGEHQPLLGLKLHDLSVLYGEYVQRMTQYLDGDDWLSLLADEVGQVESLREAEVWIDGFYGFTPQELAVVGQLMKNCAGVTVTLCLDRPYGAGERPHELDLFYPTAVTMAKLQEIREALGLPDAVVEVSKQSVQPRFANSPMLAHLEREYERRLSSRKTTYPAAGDDLERSGVVIRAAVNQRAEIEGAAREIVRLARDEHVRWRDISVRVRNLGDYGDLIGSIFTDYGIPFFLDRKRPIIHHPLVELVRSALEVVRFDWRYEAVFRCVKSDLLLPRDMEDGEVRLDRHAMDELENYVLARGIQGYRWKDDRYWELRETAALAEDAKFIPAVDDDYRQRIRMSRSAVVVPLLELEERMTSAATVFDRIEAVYRFLVGLYLPERLEAWSEAELEAGHPEKAREHSQVWDAVIGMLDQMAELMGEDEMELGTFAEVLEAGFDSLTLGLVPPSLDHVLVGSVERTRSAMTKHGFLLGVSDGVIPARLQETGVLSEPERETLLASGLSMADAARRRLLDEQFLIYTALCAPSYRLWISFPLADSEGGALLPSEVVKQIKGLFPGLTERTLETEPPAAGEIDQQLAFLMRPDRALAHLTVRLKQMMTGAADGAELWWELYNWFRSRDDWQLKLRTAVRSLLFDNSEAPLQRRTSAALYGNRLRASVSRMETFVACPFSQFASYGLKLRERKIYRLEAPDIGQLFHAALSGVVTDIQAASLDMGTLGASALREKAAAVVDRLSPRLQSEILLSSSRYRFIARRLKDVVGRATVMLAEHARKGQFRPVGLELGFGPGEPLPPLTIPLDDGRLMEIVGRIDRVDRADTDGGSLLRIIDYKSSPTALRLPELYYGLSLQMITYLDVVLTYAEQWLGVKAEPAGVLYFHVHNPVIASHNALSLEEVEAAARKKFKMRGLVTADPLVAKLMDGELDSGVRSQLVPVDIKKDGSFGARASVATSEQWNSLRRYARRMIRQIGTGITDGDVAIEPFRLGTKTACTFCAFKPVCHIDPMLEGNVVRDLAARPQDEVWRLIGGMADDEPWQAKGGAGREAARIPGAADDAEGGGADGTDRG